MDLSTLVTTVGAVVSSIALPLIGIFQYRDIKKRKLSAEASKAEAENITMYAEEWKELYEKKEKRVTELNNKIDSLYIKIDELRKTIYDLTAKNTELMVKNNALDFRKCNKHGCPDREPPSEF